ncbi:hypothetical protein ACYULU_03775 [Breznakiellaceae bacterium SP9]
MSNVTEEKERLTQKLAEQYSQNSINMEEYERVLEYINKIETKKEINSIEKIIQENSDENNENHLSVFSWRTINIKPINGNGGKFISVFGANRIVVDNLPKGRTVIEVKSIGGLTEIIVPKDIKIINKAVPIFSGIFVPNEINKENDELPELYIVGKAVFGNITIRTNNP